MTKTRSKTLGFALVFIGALGLAGVSPAQEQKPDAQKIFAEIAGVFAYAAGDQELTVVYWVKDAKLYGAPQGQEADNAELVPVDLAKMKFEATTNEGQLFEIEFSRDDAGKLNKSLLKTQGVEAPGTRIK